MENCKNRTASCYQFFVLEDWKKIGSCSGKPQKAFGIGYKLWITLYVWNHFWNFWQKIAKFVFGFRRSFQVFALGLWSVYVCQWIRVRNWVQNPLHWCIKYLIFNEYFFNLLFMKNMPFCTKSFLFLMCTRSWMNNEGICCIKRFKHICLVFLSYFI